MSECANPDCPVGCPDEHALPIGEDPSIDCGTFRDPPMDDEIIADAVARAHRLAAEWAGRTPWAWSALPGVACKYIEGCATCESWLRRVYPWLTSDRRSH